jgi:hypothetical protein
MVVSQGAVRPDEITGERIRRLEAEFGCRIVPLEQVNRLAKLTPEQYSRVQAVENEIGVSLIAYEAETRYRLAKLSAKEVGQLKQLEKSSGHVLVAYDLVYTSDRRNSIPQFDQAPLTEAQANRLQALEDESGLVLMACKK